MGIDSTKHSTVLSTHSDTEGVGMKPSELLLISLASCTAVDVVNILRKKRISLEKLEISVSGEQEADPPWTYKHIQMSYRLKGKGLTEQTVQKVIELSDEKYCSVAASLRDRVEIEHDFQILHEEG